MSTRSPHEAIHGRLAPLNLVVPCVSRVPIQQVAAEVSDIVRIGFPDGDAVPLCGQHGLSLHVVHLSTVAASSNGWRAHTRSYLYQVYAADGRKFGALHWHPGRGRVALPHAHSKTLGDPIPMGKARIPTGRISLEAVARLLVEELAVGPIRPDRRRVLTRTERAFVGARIWHNQPSLAGGPTAGRTRPA